MLGSKNVGFLFEHFQLNNSNGTCHWRITPAQTSTNHLMLKKGCSQNRDGNHHVSNFSIFNQPSFPCTEKLLQSSSGTSVQLLRHVPFPGPLFHVRNRGVYASNPEPLSRNKGSLSRANMMLCPALPRPKSKNREGTPPAAFLRSTCT